MEQKKSDHQVSKVARLEAEGTKLETKSSAENRTSMGSTNAQKNLENQPLLDKSEEEVLVSAK